MWMCDRCQSINDDARDVCPQCGVAHGAQGAVVPRPGAPGVVTPQFSQPFSGEAPAGQPGSVPPTMPPPVSFGAPPSSLGPQYQPPVSSGGSPTPSYVSGQQTTDSFRYAPPPGNSTPGNIAAAAGIGAIILIGLGALLLRLLNPFRLLFIAFGVACIVGGSYLGHRRQAFMAHAVHVTGIVTSLKIEGVGDNSMYYPEVQFTPNGGAPVTIKSSQGSRPPEFHVGETCQVYYNPLDPTDAIIDGFASRWITWILWGFGGLLIVAALFGRQTAGG